MKTVYLILAALLSSLMFCNSLAARDDHSISARDDQTGDCLQFGNCRD
jgi:hypothetical protein